MRTRKRLPARRLTRKELKRDRFVDTVFEGALWARENVRGVVVAVGAAVLVALGLVLFRTSRAAESRHASERFQEVWQAYAAGNFQLAANDFRQFRAQFGGSDWGDDASFYLADSYYRAGDTKAALGVLDDFEREHRDSPYAFAAASLRGAVEEANGDWEKAAAAYAEARTRAEYDYQTVSALMGEARARAAAGAPEEAARAYRQIVEKHPDSPAAREARVRLAEVTAKSIAGGESAGEAVSAAPAAGEAPPGTTTPPPPSATPEPVTPAPSSAAPQSEVEPTSR